MKLQLLARCFTLSAAVQATLIFSSPARAQEATDGSTNAGVEKAMKYYESLTKRPAAGYLFDRFYNSWVDAQTIEELEAFLKQKATAADATTNHRLVLAFFYAKQNEHSKALEQFRIALEKDPGNADAWFQKANAEVRTLAFETALADLATALESKPNEDMTRQILQLQGRLLARVGKNDEAMKSWQALLATSPSDEDLQEDLIEMQINEGLNKEALITAEALLEKTKDPYKKVQRRLRIGDIHSRLSNREQAIASYTKCLDEVGGDSWLEKEILDQIEQTYRRDDAVEDLKKEYAALVAKYPQRLTLRRSQARLMAELGDSETAIKTFQEILALSPGNREVREAYIALLAESTKLDDAIAQLQQLIQQLPDDGELLIKLAELHAQAQKPTEAQAALTQFLGKSDQSEQTYLRVAGILDRLKLTDASLALYKTTTEKFPESETARESYAIALHRQGKKDEAIAAWRALAQGGDKNRVMNVARQAAARDEHELAYELLSARKAEFSEDPLFLAQLCEEAQRLDKLAEAIPLATKLVGLAKDAIDLDSALNLAAKLIQRAEKVDETIASLKTTAQTAQDKCLLAELQERAGDSKSAEALLREVTKMEPEMGTALLVRLQTTRGDYVNAAESLRQLVETPNGRKPVHVQKLAEMYEKAGLLEKALEWVPEWKKLTPGSTQAWLKEADLKASLGKVKEALLSLRQAAQQFEGNEDIRAQLGAAYRSEGKLADAERVFTQLYEEAKDNANKVRWAGELAQTAMQSGKTSELVEAFEERRRTNRTSVLPLLALAEIYRVTDNYEGRRKALLEAARIKRDDIDLLLEIARIAESQNDYEQALLTLREALPMDKSDKVKQRMVRVLYAAGREEEAKKMLFELAGGPKMDARAAESMAETFINQDAWADAAEFLAPFVQKFSKDYRLAYLYAVALSESEQVDQAITEFQRIMTMREEIPAPTPATAVGGTNTPQPLKTRMNSWVDSMREFMPQGAMSFLELTQQSYQATGYKNRNNGNYPSGVGSRLQLPMTIEDAPKFAMAHLALLMADLDEEKKKLLERDLKSLSIIPMDLFPLLQNGRFNYGNSNFSELLEANPENENLMALAAMYASSDQTLSDEKRLELYQKLKDKRWLLAAMCVLSQRESELPELKQAFAEVVGKIEQLEKPNIMLLEVVSRVLNGNRQGGETEDKEQAQLIKRIRAKLMAWYRLPDPNNQFNAQLLYMVIADLVNQEDPSELIALMESETARHAEKGTGSKVNAALNPYYGMVRGRGPATTFAPATFPPSALEELPPIVMSLLGAQNNNYYTRNWQPDPDKLKAVLPTIKNPLLKALLAHKADDEATLSQVLQEMTTSKEPSFSTLLLAATWAASKDKFDEAVGVLHKAEYLPLTKDQRRTVDTSILAWAIERLDAGTALEENAPTLTNARDAALRLRRDTLGAEQKQELADVMSRIGLKVEAERLTAALNATTTLGGTSGLGMFNSQPQGFNPGTTSRVESLLEKGKSDAVVKLWQKQLKDLTKAWTASFDDSLQYQAREWLQTVRQKMSSAEPELLKSMVPPEGSTDGALFAQAAAAHQILGKTKEAREYYQKAIELKPKDQNLRLTYILFVMKDDPKMAAELLALLDVNTVSKAGQALSSLIDNLETNEQRCGLARLVLGYMTKITAAEAAKTDLSWIIYFTEQFARYGYDRSGNDSLPSLYATDQDTTRYNGSDDESKKEAAKKLQAERLAIHDQLCRAALAIPQLARFGFSKIAGLHQQQGKPMEELMDLARAALKTEFSAKVSNQYQNQYQYSSNDDDQMEFPTAEDVLLDVALKTNNPKLIEEQVLPELKGLKAVNAVKDLEADAKLYFADEPGFLNAAESYVKRRTQQGNPVQEASLWSKVIKVMSRRKIDVALDNIIISALKKSPFSYYGSGELIHVSDYTAYLLQLNKHDLAKEFQGKVAALYLGPVEKRAEFLKKNLSSNYGGNTPASGIQKWLYMFRNVTTSPAFSFFMLKVYHEQFKPFSKEVVGQQPSFYLNMGTVISKAPGKTQTERALAVLKVSPFLKSVAELDLLSMDARSELVFTQMVNQMRSGSGQAKEIHEALSQEPKTFGGDLILAMINPKASMPKDAMMVLGNHEKELKALPEEKLQQWALFLKSMRNYGGSQKQSDWPDAAKAGFDWLQSIKETSNKGKVQAVLAAKSLRELQLNEYALRELVEQNLPSLMLSEPAMAVSFFKKLQDLVAIERKTNQRSNYSFGDGSTALGYGLSSTMSNLRSSSGTPLNSDMAVNALNVYAEIVCSKQGFPVEMGTNSSLRSAINQCLLKVGDAGTPDKNKFSFEKMAQELGAKLNPDYAIVYFADLGQVISTDIEGAEKVARQSGEVVQHAWFAKLVQQALELKKKVGEATESLKKATKEEKEKAKTENREPVEIVQTGNKGITDPQQLPPEQKAVYEISQKENISLTARFAILSQVSDEARELTEPALRVASLKLLFEIWRSQSVVSSESTGRAIQRFVSMVAKMDAPLSEEIKALGADVLSGWRRMVTAKNTSGGSSSYSMQNVPVMLELACLLKDEVTVNQLLKQFGSSSSRQWVAKLIVENYTEAAKRLLNSNREGLFNTYLDSLSEVVNRGSWMYSEALAKALPDFLATLESDAAKYAAEVMLKSLPMAPGIKDGVLPDRKTRLSELAKKFDPELLKNPQQAERLINLLLAEDGVMASLDPTILPKVAGNISLATLPELDNSTLEQSKKKLVIAYIKQSVQQGNLEPLQKAVRSLAEAKSEDEYDLRRLATEVLRETMQSSNAAWEKLDPAARKSNRTFWREMIFSEQASKNFKANSSSELADTHRLVHVLLLHAMDDAIPEFNEAWAKADQKWKDYLDGVSRGFRLERDFDSITGLVWPKEQEALTKQRTELFLKILKAEVSPIGSLHTTMRYFHDVIAKGWMTKDVFLANVESIAAMKPRGGATRVEWAEFLTEADKKEEALQQLAESAKAKAEPNDDNTAWVAFIRAQAYEKLDAFELALKSMKDLPPEVMTRMEEKKSRVLPDWNSLLNTLEEKHAIHSGKPEVALQPVMAKLSKEPGDKVSLLRMARIFEAVGQNYVAKKEFAVARQFFGAALLSLTADRTKIGDANSDDLNRINVAYHQMSRELNLPTAPLVLLARRSAKWRYLDGGMVAPSNWAAVDTDVSQWKEGASPIGYDEKDLASQIEPGGDPKNRPITCYFRTTFDVPAGVELKGLMINLRRDDGAVLYLNGAEFLRSNMPEGSIEPKTPASKTVSEASEMKYYTLSPKSVSDLKHGANTLAVEVHQVKPDSSDLGLDVEIILNPSFPLDTAKSLDISDIAKALGASWEAIPAETKTLLTAPH